MELSLQTRTDIMVIGPWTTFTDRGAYGVLRTPTMPTYYAGNALLIGTPLTPDQLDGWAAVVAEEFAGSGVRHVRLEWSGPAPAPADQAAFAAAGYELQTDVCMVRPPPPPPEERDTGRAAAAVDIRPLHEADAGHLQRFLLDCNPTWGAAFIDFTVRNLYARLQTLDGGWWLGWRDGRIAGSMGLFFAGDLGRFQAVDTHPAFRRQGVARTMLQALIRQGFARPATTRLVIVADRDYFAARFYESCGFQTVHTQYELFKPPSPDPGESQAHEPS